MKLFFKIIFLEIIKKIENDYSNMDISFEPSKIKMILEKFNENEKKEILEIILVKKIIMKMSKTIIIIIYF